MNDPTLGKEKKSLTVTIDEGCGGMRLDAYLAAVVKLCSRSQLSYYGIEAFHRGNEVKLSKKVQTGEEYLISYTEPSEPDIRPEEIDLAILYEDDDVIVINKPQGMVVHPAHGNYTGTLVQGLMHYCGNLRRGFSEEPVRPGIVHRLDKDTSGVIITAKNRKAQEYLSAQFRKRRVEKVYYAVVKGRTPRQEGLIDKALVRDRQHRKRFTVSDEGGKNAETLYRLQHEQNGYSLLTLHPKTGRTHQLRVHCAHLGTPILGDPVYSRKDNKHPALGLMLHAYSLKIKLPVDGKEHTFTAPLPERFDEFMLPRE